MSVGCLSVLPSHCYRPTLELLYPGISNLLAVRKHIHVVYQLSGIAITLLQASARTTLPRDIKSSCCKKTHILYTSYHVVPSHCYRPVLELLYPGISNLLAARKITHSIQWRSQKAEKVTHIKGRLVEQVVILFNCVPFQNGNFS